MAVDKTNLFATGSLLLGLGSIIALSGSNSWYGIVLSAVLALSAAGSLYGYMTTIRREKELYAQTSGEIWQKMLTTMNRAIESSEQARKKEAEQATAQHITILENIEKTHEWLKHLELMDKISEQIKTIDKVAEQQEKNFGVLTTINEKTDYLSKINTSNNEILQEVKIIQNITKLLTTTNFALKNIVDTMEKYGDAYKSGLEDIIVTHNNLYDETTKQNKQIVEIIQKIDSNCNIAENLTSAVRQAAEVSEKTKREHIKQNTLQLDAIKDSVVKTHEWLKKIDILGKLSTQCEQNGAVLSAINEKAMCFADITESNNNILQEVKFVQDIVKLLSATNISLTDIAATAQKHDETQKSYIENVLAVQNNILSETTK